MEAANGYDEETAAVVRLLHETGAADHARREFVDLLRQDAGQSTERNREALCTTAGVFALNATLGKERLAKIIASAIKHTTAVSSKLELKLGKDDTAKTTKTSGKKANTAKA